MAADCRFCCYGDVDAVAALSKFVPRSLDGLSCVRVAPPAGSAGGLGGDVTNKSLVTRIWRLAGACLACFATGTMRAPWGQIDEEAAEVEGVSTAGTRVVVAIVPVVVVLVVADVAAFAAAGDVVVVDVVVAAVVMLSLSLLLLMSLRLLMLLLLPLLLSPLLLLLSLLLLSLSSWLPLTADLFAGVTLTPSPLSPISFHGVLMSSRVRVLLDLRAAQAA